MALSKEKLEELYNKYIQNNCTHQECEALINELGASPEDGMNEEVISQLFNATWEGLDVFPEKYDLPPLALPQETAYGTPVIEMYSLKKKMDAHCSRCLHSFDTECGSILVNSYPGN